MSPDTRKHRGAHPEDPKLFTAASLPALRAATAELSWLLGRGYPPKAALKLTGDRHSLTERQRTAVSRAACSDQCRNARCARRLDLCALRGQPVAVDGFNLLIGVEAALSGGVLLRCRDGCTRDLASIHGSYRSVCETQPAIRLVGEVLAALEPVSVRWLLDRPVSNSGRLAHRIQEAAAAAGWPWQVELVFDPDPVLGACNEIVISSDSGVIDLARRWADLTSAVVAQRVPAAWLLDLRE